MTRVLVLDGQTAQALACVRALGRSGHAVYVASTVRLPLAGWSRHCRGRFRLADETVGASRALRDWAREQRIEIVLPMTEPSCHVCNLDREQWEADGVIVGCGPAEMLARTFDKVRTLELAEPCGVRVPVRHVPSSLADASAAAAAIGYPVVIKPRFSYFPMDGRFVAGGGSRYARNAAELEAGVLACRQGDYWPLIQQFIPGQGKGVFALCDHGVPVAWFAHERLRDVRPAGSGSSLRRSVVLDPRLQEPAARLLAALGWHGPAMVEFRDDGVGAPSLMEVNGRFWGSLELSIASGVDFPSMWVSLLRGDPVSPREATAFRAGVTRRWLWGDVRRLGHLVAGTPQGFPGTYPSVLQGLKEVLGPQPRGTRIETWQSDDPMPAVGEWIQGFGELVGSIRSPRPVTKPSLRVLMITSGWPTPGQPQTTHFVKRQAEFVRAAGVEVDVFHFRGVRKLLNYIVAWVKVRRRLRRGAYDLVHAQFGQSGLLALPRTAPLVVTYRGSDLLGIVGADGRYLRIGKLLTGIARFVARRADAVILVSEHMRAALPPGVPVDLVLPSGIDLELFRPVPAAEARQRLGLPAERHLVLFAGNPAQARKRYDLAQRAVGILNRSLDAELVVAWGVPHTDMPLYMSACSVLVVTSMQEGSTNVVKEALACDLPVVSVAVGDVAERLRGVAGCELCVDERPEAIAAALERVLRRGGRVAGREAVQQLDEHRQTERLIGLYRRVRERWRTEPDTAHPEAALRSVP